jgi:hypothetical protein
MKNNRQFIFKRPRLVYLIQYRWLEYLNNDWTFLNLVHIPKDKLSIYLRCHTDFSQIKIFD